MTAPIATTPTGWVSLPLDDVCEVILGQSPPGSTYNTEGNGLPFFQGKAEFGDYYPTAVKWCTEPKKIAERNDVLISVRAPVGPTNLCPTQACIGRGLAALRPHNGMPSRYLLYAMRSTVDALTERATGSTFEAINGANLRAHKISVAPPKEQERIVAEIEKQFTRLEAGVSALKRALTNVKRYRAAVLKAACEGKLVPTEAELARQEGRPYETGAQLLERILAERRKNYQGRGNYKEPAVPDISNLPELPEGWIWASLEQLTSAHRPICYGILMPKDNVPDGVLYVKVKDLKGDKIDVSSLHRTTKAIADKYKRSALQAGDLLLAIRGTYGRVAEVPPELDGGNVTQDTARLAVSGIANRDFLAAYLRSPDCQNYFKRVARGVAVKGVNIGDVKPTPVALAPRVEQSRIVAEVERHLSVADEVEATLTANLQRAARLRQSILQKAFSGQLGSSG